MLNFNDALEIISNEIAISDFPNDEALLVTIKISSLNMSIIYDIDYMMIFNTLKFKVFVKRQK